MTTVQQLPDEAKARLTTWIIDQHRAGIEAPFVKDEQVQFARSSRALSYSERTERFFLGLAARGWGFRDHLRSSGVADDTYFRDQCFVASWAELADDRDIISFLQLLLDEGLMVVTGGNHRLTSKGFQRLEAAERNSRASAQGFVAMWFDSSLAEVYDEGFAEGIRRAGFAPLRIDKKEHNNKIDDEIIAEIKRSKFIVADFTCGRVSDADGKEHWLQRGGVYFETGFAYGLGIPVIWTCRRGDENGMHFDTRQFAHILWDKSVDLAESLYNRIRHIVGEGPRINLPG